jgi:hypothetical protein
MSVGLTIVNPTNELVVSNEGRMLHFLAKAVHQYTVQVSGDVEQGKTGARVAGYSMYRLTLPEETPFILGIDLPSYARPADRAVGILGITYVSPGVYDIKAACGSHYDQNYFDTVQYAVDIWAFGYVSAPSKNYGLALYNTAGQLTADFSRPHILMPRWASQDYSVVKTQTIPALSRPVVLGMPTYSYGDLFDRPEGWLYYYKLDCDLWVRNGTTLKAEKRMQKMYGCNDLNDDAYMGRGPAMAIVIEGAYLP